MNNCIVLTYEKGDFLQIFSTMPAGSSTTHFGKVFRSFCEEIGHRGYLSFLFLRQRGHKGRGTISIPTWVLLLKNGRHMSICRFFFWYWKLGNLTFFSSMYSRVYQNLCYIKRDSFNMILIKMKKFSFLFFTLRNHNKKWSPKVLPDKILKNIEIFDFFWKILMKSCNVTI